MSNLTFKVTVEYICPDVISEELFISDFGGDAKKVWEFLEDTPEGLCEGQKTVRVEVVND